MEVTFETQFGIVGVMKFDGGIFARVGEEQVGKNFDMARRLPEAGEQRR